MIRGAPGGLEIDQRGGEFLPVEGQGGYALSL